VHNTLGRIVTKTYGGQSTPLVPRSGLLAPPELLHVATPGA